MNDVAVNEHTHVFVLVASNSFGKTKEYEFLQGESKCGNTHMYTHTTEIPHMGVWETPLVSIQQAK